MEKSPPKALLMAYVWPEATSSAAGLRDRNLLELLKREGWELHMSSGAKPNEFKEQFEVEGIRTHHFEPNDSRFDEWIASLAPEIVIFDRFITEEQFGWRVKDHSPGSLRITDTQDLHFLRRARQSAHERGATLDQIARLDPASVEVDTSEDALREIASIYRSDLSLIISDFELALLVDRFKVPEKLLHLYRFHYKKVLRTFSPFLERGGFTMIGNFRHPPNADAAIWLNKEIWPEIRKLLPDAQVHLYGAYPPREISALHDPKAGFHMMGWATDQFETLSKYRVSLAPLRFGAGIKGKISDSWSVGTPVVTTPIGAEGMGAGSEFARWVGSDARSLAALAAQLYHNEDEWRRAQARGFEVLESLYNPDVQGRELIGRLRHALEDLESHRRDNFVGQMMWHHQRRSTTYFSRWIELKNKS